MLVLSRKIGEQVVIGDNVCVTVVAVHGNRVRLGFVAPEDIAICREELLGEDDSGFRLALASRLTNPRER